MNTVIKKQFIAILGLVIPFAACNQMSEHVKDESAGLNGGFEITNNGLPVNWLMYTPKTVQNSDFEISLDQAEFKEGKQSLKFDVRECSDDGGRYSPGFTNEFFDVGKYVGPATYKVSFWIKNDGARFKVTAGGVEAKKGDMSTLIEGDEKIDVWKLFEYEVEVPEERWLRMQLNILQPGTFWIDDVRIDKI